MKHQFVEYIPEFIEENTLYISLQFSTAIHKCMCGCGNEVVTPISPKDWSIIYNGETITLQPSIGNWNFECKSHYWIRKNEVIICPKWDSDKIDIGVKKLKNGKKKKIKKINLKSIIKFF